MRDDEVLVCALIAIVALAAPVTVTVPAPLTLSLPLDRYALSASGVPYRLTVKPLLAAMPVASVLAAFTAVSDSHARDAPLAPVNISVTGPAETKGCAPNGMATTAPGVVYTVVGTTKLAAAPVTVACEVAASVAVVETLPPVEFASSMVRVVVVPEPR